MEMLTTVTTTGCCSNWVIKTLELLLASNESTVLVIGDSRFALDALLIAALRRTQNWSCTSIIAEMRILTGRKQFDYEQFVESLDVSSVVVPNPLPRCVLILSVAIFLLI